MFFLIVPAILFVFAIYTDFRLFYDSPLPKSVKIIASALILIGAESMLLVRLSSVYFMPLPTNVQRIAGVLAALMLILFVIVFARDVIIFLGFILKKLSSGPEPFSVISFITSPKFSAAIFILTSLVVLYGAWQGLRVPDVKEVTINIKNLDPALKGLKIVQLTDIHIGSAFDGNWLNEVVKKVNTLDADVVLVTGDMVDGSPEILRPELEALDKIQSKLGVYYSYGNHDYYSNIHTWIAEHKNQGRNLLINESVILNHNGADFAIIGLPDSGTRSGADFVMDFEQALSKVPSDILKIAMAHQPTAALESVKNGIDLQLSGHTHGGQIFLVFPVVNASNGGFRAGLFDVGDLKLYVSSGTGLWGNMPMRLGTKSEITLITLE